MFQRHMIIVANRLQNAQLTAPKLFSSSSRKKKKPDAEDVVVVDEENNNSDDDSQNGGAAEASPNEKATTGGIGDTIQAKLKDYDTVAFELRIKSLKAHRSLLQYIKHNSIYLAFWVYLAVGTIFYSTYDNKNGAANTVGSRVIHGYYESITIGFSVGLGTQDTTYIPNVWFSSAYILFGAAIIVVMLTVAGNEVEEKASMAMYKSLQRRENYEKKMSRENPLHIRTKAFLSYNAAYLIVIIAWLLWLVFIIVWAMLEVPEWHFPEAQYFAVSLCSSAGSFSLPTTSSDIAYLLAGISMMIGVPLMAMGISAIIIMIWQGHRFKAVKEAAWNDVTQNELDLLKQLGIVEIGEGEELPKGGFILLGLLRMGQDVGVIKYLADAHETIDERGGVIIRATSAENGGSIVHYANLSGYQESHGADSLRFSGGKFNEREESLTRFVGGNALSPIAKSITRTTDTKSSTAEENA